MISSTSLDLPEHRQKLIEVCNRLGVVPLAMEHLGADGRTPAQVSLEMVDRADLYLLVLGWRYGFVPEGSTISITEMEYERALAQYRRGELSSILVFVSDAEHLFRTSDIDRDDSRVDRLRSRVALEHVIVQFRSVGDLGEKAIQSLSESLTEFRHSSTGGPPEIFRLPARPEPFTAHPYALLQTSRVIGRSEERALIDSWFRAGADASTLLFLVAMGGMGKSALTWRWYSDAVGRRQDGLDGAIWWSFYESDAGYERFVTRCCAYLSGNSEERIQKAELSKREELLLSLLESGRFLIVLDGAERLLRAYATLDATYIHDEALDEETAHAIASGERVSQRDADDFHRRRRLREFTDHRAARLFQRIRLIRRSRVLVSSRLFPSSLEDDGAKPLPGCDVVFLGGMATTDAIELWREFGATGQDADLTEMFEQLGNFPLAIRTLAGTVAKFRPAPGDFGRWREHNPDFLSTDAALRRTTRHVLRYALADLGADELQVLRILAAFRMPVDWQVLVEVVGRLPRAGVEEPVLAGCLQSLEDRGLMGWDRKANRYDLHPVVRLSTWNATPEADRVLIMSAVYDHYSRQLAEQQLSGGEKRLNTRIEYFYALGAMGRHSEAYKYFAKELYELTLHAESLVRVHLELIEQFFPNGLTEAPVFEDGRRRGRLHRWLTYAYMMVGEPGAAVELTVGGLRPEWLSQAAPNWRELYFALAECGRLREAEAALAMVFLEHDDLRGPAAANLATLPWVVYQLDRRGAVDIADRCANRYERLSKWDGALSGDAGVRRMVRDQLLSADRLLDHGSIRQAGRLLKSVERNIEDLHRTRETIRLLQLRGKVERLKGHGAAAGRHLEEALLLARSHGVVSLEMTCLIELARVAKADGRSVDALDHLREVYEPVHRGPYPMEEADARALAAEIAFESGDRSTAVAEAGRAFAMAWCDGPPYAYASGLHSAASVLSRCGAQPPLLPAFDRARFAGLPEVSVSASGDIEVNADRWGGRTSMLGRFLVIARFRATRTPTPLSPRGKRTS